MPTVLRIGPYRFYFYGIDRVEPRHVHVTGPGASAKFWLDEVRLARNDGYNLKELRRVQRLVEEHRQELSDAWDEFFA